MKLKVSFRDSQQIFEQEVKEFPFIVGRQETSDLVISAQGVSGQHVEISLDERRIMIRDLGSRNGTYIDGEMVSVKVISLPCQLRLGANVILDLDHSEDELQEEESGMQTGTAVEKHTGVRLFARNYGRHAAPQPLRFGDEPRDIWNLLWRYAGELDYRFAIAFLLFCSFCFVMLRMVAYDDSWLGLLGRFFGYPIGAALMSVILAALLAVPGWLIRRKFEIKPLFYACLFLAMQGILQSEFLLPLSIVDVWGVIAKMVSVPLLVFQYLFFFYFLFFSAFPQRWGKYLLAASVVSGVLASLGSVQTALTVDKQEVFRATFLSPSAPMRGLAGGAVPPAVLAKEIKEGAVTASMDESDTAQSEGAPAHATPDPTVDAPAMEAESPKTP